MRPVYFVGDIHGNFLYLRYRIRNNNAFKDSIIISVGDFGVGFPKNAKAEKTDLEKLNKTLIDNNVMVYVIRGNHDNPALFREHNNIQSNIVLLPDYSVLTIDNYKYLCVGGAISIDRTSRAQDIYWWEDEVFVLNTDKVMKCDVLVTHTAPLWLGPTTKLEGINWAKKDSSLADDLYNERLLVSKLVELCSPRRLYAGHFHECYTGEHNNCVGRILNIEEIVLCHFCKESELLYNK